MSQIIWLDRLPENAPVLEPLFNGLVYQECGKVEYNVCKHCEGDVDSLYLKALMATHQVDQKNIVKVFWGGRVLGELRGQC